MARGISFLIISILSFGAFAATQAVANQQSALKQEDSVSPVKRFENSLDFRIRGESKKTIFQQTNRSNAEVDLNTKYHAFDNLQLSGILSLYSGSGYYQNRKENSGQYANAEIQEFLVTPNYNFSDSTNAKIDLGMFEMYRRYSGLLFDWGTRFAGANEELRFGSTEKNFNFALSQFVVSNSTKTNSQSNQQSTPQFSTVNLGYKNENLISNPAINVKLDTQLGYFQFQNPTTGLAEDSSQMGNTTVQMDASGLYQFKNKYQGIYLNNELNLTFKKLQVLTNLNYLKNNEVNATLGEAYQLKTAALYRLNSSFEIGPRVSYYSIGPDCTIASLSDDGTNRVGYQAGVFAKMNTKAGKYQASLSTGKEKQVYYIPSKFDETITQLKFEVYNVEF